MSVCPTVHLSIIVLITKIRLYNFDPLITGVYRIIHKFSYFCSKTYCGHWLEPPRWGESNEYPQLMFWAAIGILSEFFIWKSSFFGGDIFNIFEYAWFRNEKRTSLSILDCGYSLEPQRQGGSNEYPQSMFLSRNKKNNVYSCKPQFYYIKVRLKGSKLHRYVLVVRVRFRASKTDLSPRVAFLLLFCLWWGSSWSCLLLSCVLASDSHLTLCFVILWCIYLVWSVSFLNYLYWKTDSPVLSCFARTQLY